MDKNLINSNEVDDDSEYHKLRNLLLTKYDYSLFIDYNSHNEKSLHTIFGIKEMSYYISLYELHKYNSLLMGIEHIYLIYGNNNSSMHENYVMPEYMTNYINDYKIPVEIIKCNLSKFARMFPEFLNNHFNSSDSYYSYARSMNGQIYEDTYNCGNLPGTNIFSKLIIGESLDFNIFEDNEFIQKKIKELKLNKVDVIINVNNNEIYNKNIVDILKKNNIHVYSYPLYESNNLIHEYLNEQNFFQAGDMLNNQISKGKKVYLHCYIGKNRSISVAIDYMVRYLKMPLKIACEQVYLKKTYATQYKFIRIVWHNAKANEDKPIPICKILGDTCSIGNTNAFYGLGFYDVHNLDVIACRKSIPLNKNDTIITHYLENNINNDEHNDETDFNSKCIIQ
jgi:protein-tyrosine phosphatase